MGQSLEQLKSSPESRDAFVKALTESGYPSLLSATEQGILDTRTLNSWSWEVLDAHGLLEPVTFIKMVEFMAGSCNCTDSVWLTNCHFVKNGIGLEDKNNLTFSCDLQEQAEIAKQTAEYYLEAVNSNRKLATKLALRHNVIFDEESGNEWDVRFLKSRGVNTVDLFKLVEGMRTSRDCHNCIGCTHCNSCVRSEECSHSTHLIECEECSYSSNLTRCVNTHYSRTCANCDNVHFTEQSWSLTESQFCRNSKASSNLNMCASCKECEDCINTVSSEKTRGARLKVAMYKNNQIGSVKGVEESV